MQQPNRSSRPKNAKEIWNQIQQRGLAQVAYTSLAAGPAHAPLFSCLCTVTMTGVHMLEGVGEARSKQEAHKLAAAEAIKHLGCLITQAEPAETGDLDLQQISLILIQSFFADSFPTQT